jgi:TolB-like protein
MIAQLGHLDPQHLGLIGRTSVMHYKDTHQPLEQIGRELGVQYVLEGSVRRDANKVRISAQVNSSKRPVACVGAAVRPGTDQSVGSSG